MTTYEIAACTTLDASPEEVWTVLDNIPGWKNWMPATRNVRIDILSDGSPRPGYRFRLSGGMVHASMEVTGYTSLERTIQFRLNLPPVSGETQCVVTPLENGQCYLERIDRLFLPGPLVKFLDTTQRTRFENLAADFMRALKQAVTQEAPYREKETYVGAPAT
jgi:hypothetical protein